MRRVPKMRSAPLGESSSSDGSACFVRLPTDCSAVRVARSSITDRRGHAVPSRQRDRTVSLSIVRLMSLCVRVHAVAASAM
jgi:hypothetical protein